MWRLLVFLLPFTSWSQQSLNVQFLDSWQDDNLVGLSSGLKYSDCWGYVQNGREYAMLGSTEGVHFFEITASNQLRLIDSIQGKFAYPSVIHRDIKIFRNYAFLVCDEGFSSLQIVDLSTLPDSVNVVYENDSTFTRVHNLFIDEPNELLYACSVQPSQNGMLQSLISMQVYSIADVLNPALVYEGPNDIPEVHDAYVRDNIAYLNCGFDGIRVYDFSNPSAPVFKQNLSFYLDQGYNHQGWLSPDGTKYVFGDETNGIKLKWCSVVDHELDIEGQFGTNFMDGSVPHNVMITNDFAFVAYYNEGLRIYDLRHKLPKEIAHFDTYPEEEALFKMNGAWGMYSELPSERLLVSDRKHGLFLLDFKRSVFETMIPNDIAIYPNPVYENTSITIRMEDTKQTGYTAKMYDMSGRLVLEQSTQFSNYLILQAPATSGVYSLRITIPSEDAEEIAFDSKIVVL